MPEYVKLDSRIRNKHGTLKEWMEYGDAVLLKGELAVVEVTEDDLGPEYVLDELPISLVKIGDGETAFSNLPWLTARAGDVYQWAKEELKPTYDTTEIQGFDEAVTGLIQAQDTDTHYRLVQDNSRLAAEHIMTITLQQAPRGSDSYTDVDGSELEIAFYDDQSVKDRLAELELKVGSTAVQTQITVALDEAKAALQAEIDKKQDILVFKDAETYPYTGTDEDGKAVTNGWVSEQIETAAAELQAAIDTKQDLLHWAGADADEGAYQYDPESNPAVSQSFLEKDQAEQGARITTEIQTATSTLQGELLSNITETQNFLQEQLSQGDEAVRTELLERMETEHAAIREQITAEVTASQETLQGNLEAARADLDQAIAQKQDMLQWAGEEAQAYDGYFSKAVASAYLDATMTQARAEISGEIDTDVQTLQDSVTEALAGKQDTLSFAGETEYNPDANRAVTEAYLQTQNEAQSEMFQEKLDAMQQAIMDSLNTKQSMLEFAGDVEYSPEDNRVATEQYVQAQDTAVTETLSAEIQTLRETMTAGLAKKQDTLAFAGTVDYNPEVNKVVTEKFLEGQLAGLSGAMAWIGSKESLPTEEENASYRQGDVITVNGVEYAFNGSGWQELGDESKYSALVPSWNAAADKAHEHVNLDLLDTISAEDLANWKDRNIAHLEANTDEEYIILDCGSAEITEPAEPVA